MMDNWVDLYSIPDDSSIKIFAGTVIRIYDDSLFSKTGYYDYLISFIYGNNDYLQMTCLSCGEEGNIVSILKLSKEDKSEYISISELKRMNNGYDKVMINQQPSIKVE